jgi:hypothetical protein
MDLTDEIMKNILNPQKLKKTIHKYGVSSGKGFVSEKREGTKINEHGILEEVEVNTTFIDTLDDGSAINDKNIVICGNCGAAVHIDSVRECERCKKKICILCARQKKNTEKFFCCLAHQIPLLGL